MKHLFLAFLSCIILQNISAQHIWHMSTMPLSPTIYDSIYIIDSISSPSTGFYLKNCTVSKSNDTIKIINCYQNGTGFDIWGYIKDTIPIGKLSAGLYHCFLYSREYYRATINDPDLPCDSFPFLDSLNITFFVSQYPSGINDIDYSNITVSPNPANNKLTISASITDMRIIALDMAGREYLVPYSGHDVDISSLSAGVYCLRMQSKDRTMVRRFVKE